MSPWERLCLFTRHSIYMRSWLTCMFSLNKVCLFIKKIGPPIITTWELFQSLPFSLMCLRIGLKGFIPLLLLANLLVLYQHSISFQLWNNNVVVSQLPRYLQVSLLLYRLWIYTMLTPLSRPEPKVWARHVTTAAHP